jgi:juvenile hormone acid methyltransferase
VSACLLLAVELHTRQEKNRLPPVMNNASLYSQYNDLQKSDAKFALDNFFQTITFQNEDNILDVGSGDGAVTLELLLPRLKRFKKLVGVDVSEKMLQFARNRSQTSPKVDFVCLDIASVRIPQQFAQHFDHIFSFYCLNWICEERYVFNLIQSLISLRHFRQPQALKNLFDMLRPGGDALLTAAVHNAVYNLHERMGQSEKWKSDLTNFKQYISPYYFWSDADNKLRQLLENTSFVVRACKIVERSFIFPNMDNFSSNNLT